MSLIKSFSMCFPRQSIIGAAFILPQENVFAALLALN